MSNRKNKTKTPARPKTHQELEEHYAKLNASIFPKKFVSLISADCPIEGCADALPRRIPSGAGTRPRDLEDGKQNDTTPINNMGGTENGQIKRVNVDYLGCELSIDDGLEDIELYLTGSKNKAASIRIPRQNSGVNARVGFVDQVSFTVRVDDVLGRSTKPPYDLLKSGYNHASNSADNFKNTNVDLHEGLGIVESFTFTDTSEEQRAVYKLSLILLAIFGFGVIRKRTAGLNFYRDSYDLGEGLGVLCIGGQRGTINVMIYGQGAFAASWADRNKVDNWEKRLHYYLSMVEGKLSRIDIAADLFERQYSPEQLKADHESGKTSLTNKKPFAETRGDWTLGVNTGKTMYIGKRANGKMLRVYEKGMQILKEYALKALEQKNHELARLKDWVRIEGEWHNKDRILNLDMLLNPGKYLAGMYPALNFLSEIQVRVDTIKKQANATVESAAQAVKRQYGKTLWALIQLKGFDAIREICDNPKGELPKWARSMGELPPIDDECWMTLEQQYKDAPF